MTTPVTAIHQLLASIDACFGGRAPWNELIDLEVAVETAAKFKLDVSFALVAERFARFSVNDKGETDAFRRRVRDKADFCGIDRAVLAQLFDVSSPGEVQTTLGVKWRGGDPVPDRTSVYLEELATHPRGHDIRATVVRLAGGDAPALHDGAGANAVCLDFSRGKLMGSKTYDVFLESGDAPPPALPGVLAEIRDQLPFHKVNRTRRTMLAHRFDRRGRIVGYKLFWMTELHDRPLADEAWAQFDLLRKRVGGGAHEAIEAALSELRANFRAQKDAMLFPDLIGVNVDELAANPSVVVHVSIR